MVYITAVIHKHITLFLASTDNRMISMQCAHEWTISQ